MGITIIIKDGIPKGRTRTSTENELNHHWGTSSFKNEEDKDKCAFLERKFKERLGADNSRITARLINKVK